MLSNKLSGRKLAAIMFVDMVGYTAMMEENEQYAIHLRALKRRILEHQLQAHSGSIIQYYGDGALCIFRSALNAARSAVEIQKEVRSCSIPVRIGIHLGEIVRDPEGVYGHAVNVASRLESLAAPGGTLISEQVYQEIKNQNSLKAAISELGSFLFKNVKHPMQVYALQFHGKKLHEQLLLGQWSEQERKQTHNELVHKILDQLVEGVIN